MTEAEIRLWARLRDRRLDGWNFRRQHPLPPFVADFACIEARLIVEVDGGQHQDSERDRTRDKYLAENEWRVLRFWNNDVLANTEGVLQQILAALAPTPALPRCAGEGASVVESSTP